MVEMGGPVTLPRRKMLPHCLRAVELGAWRMAGTKKMDIARVAPPHREERVIPTVWAVRMESGVSIVSYFVGG